MIDTTALWNVVRDGGIVAVAILIVLSLGSGWAYTRGQHKSIVDLKDAVIAEKSATILRLEERIAEKDTTIAKFAEPVRILSESIVSLKVGGG